MFSARDWCQVLDRFQRNPHVGPGDISVTLGPIDGLMGPTAGAQYTARAGALAVLAGMYDSTSKLRLIHDRRPAVMIGTASYLLRLVDVAAELGIDLRTLGIRTVLSVGEPGAAVAATRHRLTEGWGAFVNDGYGMTELFPLGGGCRDSRAIHVVSDLVITEIVDPDTGCSRPPGEPGEIVYTNLVSDTQPLLRYRTRDIARLAPPGPCACGFTGMRLERSIEGRVDDMIWLRGANVFPSAVEGVVRGFEQLGSEYQLVVDGTRASPDLTVRAELLEAQTPVERETLETRIGEALRAAIRVRVGIELVPAGSLPRAEGGGKPTRVVDRRLG